MLKLYDMSPYFITVNLIQTGINLLSYSSPVSYIINIFGNINIFSILIALFIKEHIFKFTDVFTKSLSIDFPLTFNYCSCLINMLYITNEIVYYSDKTLIYSDKVFSGIMIVLFILNITILISTRNVVQHLLYTILIILYGGNTYGIEDYLIQNTNFTEITEQTLYNIRISITIPFILNLFILFGYIGCYHNYKNRYNHTLNKNNASQVVTICENIEEIGGSYGNMENIQKKELKRNNLIKFTKIKSCVYYRNKFKLL